MNKNTKMYITIDDVLVERKCGIWCCLYKDYLKINKTHRKEDFYKWCNKHKLYSDSDCITLKF